MNRNRDRAIENLSTAMIITAVVGGIYAVATIAWYFISASV